MARIFPCYCRKIPVQHAITITASNLYWTDIAASQGPLSFHGTEHLEITERKVRTVSRRRGGGGGGGCSQTSQLNFSRRSFVTILTYNSDLAPCDFHVLSPTRAKRGLAKRRYRFNEDWRREWLSHVEREYFDKGHGKIRAT